MHPLLCLESKVECFFRLDQAGRQDLKHIQLGIACVHEMLGASIDAAAQKQVLSMVERIAAVAAEEYGIRLRHEKGVAIEAALPLGRVRAAAPDLPKLAAFLEKRWPQLETRIRTREEACRKRFPRKEVE